MPSTSTKRTIVTMAYEEISLSGYEFDVTPEEQATALRRLDALMAEWEPTIALGYNFPLKVGQGNLDDPTGIPDFAVDVAAKYLALRIAPMMGKSISAETRYAASVGMVNLRNMTVVVPVATLPKTTPRGSGNRWGSRFSPFVLGDDANMLPTLQPLALTISTTQAGVGFSTIILGTTAGSQLALLVNPNGYYTLTSAPGVVTVNGVVPLVWSLNRAAVGLFASSEAVVIQETLGTANDSPKSTPLLFNITAAPFTAPQRAAYVPVLAL